MWAEENISTSIQVNGETVPQWEFKDVWVKKPTLNEKRTMKKIEVEDLLKENISEIMHI